MLERLTAEVLRVPGSPVTWDQTFTAALLSIGGDVKGASPTAAAVLGLEGFERRGDIHVVVPRSQRVPASRIPPGVVVHRSTRLERLDVTTVEGRPITSAARTIIDLAAQGVDERRLDRAIDSAVREGWTSVAFLARRLDALRGSGRHGVALIEHHLPDSGGHSALERHFLRLVREAGLPRPTCQRVFRRDGRFIARSDFAFPGTDVVIEVTGRQGHSTPLDRQKDAQRRNELLDIGIRAYEYTWEDVTRRPEYVVRTLRERLGLEP